MSIILAEDRSAAGILPDKEEDFYFTDVSKKDVNNMLASAMFQEIVRLKKYRKQEERKNAHIFILSCFQALTENLQKGPDQETSQLDKILQHRSAKEAQPIDLELKDAEGKGVKDVPDKEAAQARNQTVRKGA